MVFPYSLLNIGLTLVGFLTGSKNVAIYKGNSEILSRADILECHVNDYAKLMEHPIETGVIITDHKIFMPVEITIKIALPTYLWETVHSQLNNAYRNADFLVVKTKNKYYRNMQIQAVPHDERPENIDRLVFEIAFKEVLIVEPKFVAMPKGGVSAPQSASKTDLGQKAPQASTVLLDLLGGYLK